MIPYVIRTDRASTLKDAELVCAVANNSSWGALRTLFVRWLDPTPTPAMLDEMPMSQVNVLGAELMAQITDAQNRTNKHADLFARVDAKTKH